MLGKSLQNHILDLRLNLRLAGGENIVYGVAADDGTDAALRDVFQNRKRILGCIHCLHGIAVAVFHIEVDINKVEVGCDHQRFVLVDGIVSGVVADGKSLNGRVDLSYLLDKRNLEVKTGTGDSACLT